MPNTALKPFIFYWILITYKQVTILFYIFQMWKLQHSEGDYPNDKDVKC